MSPEVSAPDWFSLLKLKQRIQHPFIVYDIIMDIPEILQKCLREQEENIRKIASNLNKKQIKAIYLIGSGNSFYAAISAKYAIEELAGITCISEESFELLNYTLPSLTNAKSISNQSVIGISLSGATKACVDAIKLASEKGSYTIGIVGESDTPLQKAAKDAIIIPKGVRKDIPVRVNTFSTVVFVANMLALALREEQKGTGNVSKDFHEQLSNIPSMLSRIIRDVEPQVMELGKKYVTDEDFYFIGGGPNYGTALDGALMMNEMSRARPWAWEVEEMCHGPWSTLRRKSIVVIIAPPGKSYPRLEKLVQGIKDKIGATIISVVRKGDSSKLVEKSDDVIEIPHGDVPEILTPVIYDVPLLLFAYYRAISGNINPDAHGMDRAGFDELPRILHPPGWH